MLSIYNSCPDLFWNVGCYLSLQLWYQISGNVTAAINTTHQDSMEY